MLGSGGYIYVGDWWLYASWAIVAYAAWCIAGNEVALIPASVFARIFVSFPAIPQRLVRVFVYACAFACAYSLAGFVWRSADLRIFAAVAVAVPLRAAVQFYRNYKPVQSSPGFVSARPFGSQ
jgi:hypothetical protein